jgi:hypothetical protein
MATTTKKKPFKGKYPGPDELKGDKKKLAIWNASKRAAANKPATTPKPPANTPEAPQDQTEAPQTEAPIGSSDTGTLGLQSNIDIENAVNEAATARKEAEAEAARIKSEAMLEEARSKAQAEVEAKYARGRTNAGAAYRGLKGTTAQTKVQDTESDIALKDQNIAAAKSAKDAFAEGLVTAADQKKLDAEAWASGKRLEFTAEQSKKNPTAGTTPSNAGVSAPKPPAEINPIKDTGTSSVVKASKGYKGKYKGPDAFKGDKALNAAWKAAAKRRAKGKK